MTVDEARARLAEIDNELHGQQVGTDLLHQPSRRDRIGYAAFVAAELARHERHEALNRERAELCAMLPPTGEASGQRMVIARNLGEISLRTWAEIDVRPDPEYSDDPWDRGDREMGITRYSR